jgi:hypothetical protein
MFYLSIGYLRAPVIPAREYARVLRAQGYGLQAIADELGVVLSTAWRWCIGVPSDAAEARRKAVRVRRPMSQEQRLKISVAMHLAWSKRRR